MQKLIDKASAYFAGARLRAQRRKSPWNLLLIPLCGGSAIAVYWVLFKLVWSFNLVFYPEHRLRDFWQEGISPGSFVLSFLMVVPLMPGAIGAGFLLGNLLAWLIAPARRTFDAEARNHPGTGFREAMRGLLRFTAATLPLGAALALTAARLLRSLR